MSVDVELGKVFQLEGPREMGRIMQWRLIGLNSSNSYLTIRVRVSFYQAGPGTCISLEICLGQSPTMVIPYST